MTYDRPSSLVKSNLLKLAPQGQFALHTPPISPIGPYPTIGFPNETVAECVALFFRFHHPQCKIIDRDMFLVDYSQPSYARKTSSLAVEYSICAMGALMSPDMNIRDLADVFVTAAIRELDSATLLSPSESSIQALLLLSCYEIGKGNFSKAWMLSGILIPLFGCVTPN